MSEFIDYLKDTFAPFGEVQSRKMFGGYGIFYQGIMIALVADETLYLKTDKQSQTIFSEHSLAAFEYNKNGKAVKMSYALAPEEIYEDPDQLIYWANLAYEAALRANKNKKK